MAEIPTVAARPKAAVVLRPTRTKVGARVAAAKRRRDVFMIQVSFLVRPFG